MAYIAQTTLLVDKDGKTAQVSEGKEVKKDWPSQEVFEKWVTDGSVVEYTKSTSEKDAETRAAELEAKVAELEKQLAAAKTSTPTPTK